MTTIFLSSTFEDLKDFRQAVLEGLRQSEYDVVNMENYVAGAQRPVEKCLKDVAKAGLYIGLFAFRYGYVPPAQHQNPRGLSMTELEYRKAQELKIPCLVFLAKEDYSGLSLKLVDACTGDNDKGEKINALRKELLTETYVSEFSDPQQLARLVLAAVKTQLEQLAHSADETAQPSDVPSPIIWDINTQGSPYPGLLHFTRKHASVFCGRELEVGEVLDRLRQPENRFLLISGTSGSGKSSLVEAGVLPQMENGGLSSDQPYTCVRMVPSQGSHLFDALVRPLHAVVERAGSSAFELAEKLLKEPQSLSKQLQVMAANGLEGASLVLFVDQMEEVFTVCDPAHAAAFLSGLYQASHEGSLQVIATIRSDFLSYCYDHPDLLTVLKGTGHYPLGAADAISIRDMIAQPARRAGLTISDKLVRTMVKVVGATPGSLPLLAFALQQLFNRRIGNALTEEVYEQELGGLAGAIGLHAEEVEKKIPTVVNVTTEEALSKVFAPLVAMVSEGQPTRKRVRKDAYEAPWRPVVDLLIKERLMQGEEGEQAEGLVSIAHETLFQAWPSLAKWVAENQQDLFTLRQADMQAGEWERHGYDPSDLWLNPARVRAARQAIKNFGKTTSPVLARFLNPVQELITVLERPEVSHQDRFQIGLTILLFGDDPRPGVGVKDGIPDIEWINIPGGKIRLEEVDHVFTVKPFKIAKYPVTNAQFHAFIDDGGYEPDQEWWKGLQYQESESSTWREPNAPRENVSWFEAVAFCRWLSARRNEVIRLPTEWEWQQAATGGNPANDYPWGTEWDPARCNSDESRLNRTTPVGLYPQGATAQGVMDLAGNVWEWCLNTDENLEQPTSLDVDAWVGLRVVRGGSWLNDPDFLRSSDRNRFTSGSRSSFLGFRLAQGTR